MLYPYPARRGTCPARPREVPRQVASVVVANDASVRRAGRFQRRFECQNQSIQPIPAGAKDGPFNGEQRTEEEERPWDLYP